MASVNVLERLRKGVDVKIGTEEQFAVVPKWANRDSNISDGAFRVYVELCGYADQDGMCFPSMSTLAADLGCSRETVKRSVRELERCGVLSREQRFEDGRQTSNVYLVKRFSGQVGGSDLTRGSGSDLTRGSGSDLTHQELYQLELEQKKVSTDVQTSSKKVSKEAERLAKMFATELYRNGFTVPEKGTANHKKWLVEFDRLLRIGPPGANSPVPASEVERVIRFATSDSFWAGNVLSAAKFRKHYPRLRFQSGVGGRVGSVGTGGVA